MGKPRARFFCVSHTGGVRLREQGSGERVLRHHRQHLLGGSERFHRTLSAQGAGGGGAHPARGGGHTRRDGRRLHLGDLRGGRLHAGRHARIGAGTGEALSAPRCGAPHLRGRERGGNLAPDGGLSGQRGARHPRAPGRHPRGHDARRSRVRRVPLRRRPRALALQPWRVPLHRRGVLSRGPPRNAR